MLTIPIFPLSVKNVILKENIVSKQTCREHDQNGAKSCLEFAESRLWLLLAVEQFHEQLQLAVLCIQHI